MFYEDDDFFNQILRSHEEGDGKKGKEYMKKSNGVDPDPVGSKTVGRIRIRKKNHLGSGSGKLRI
jgi:hypothetical protein